MPPQEESPRRVDLDVVDEIRQELAGKGEIPSIKFKGETFYLEPDMPLEAIEIFAEVSEWLDRIDGIEKERGSAAANREATKLGRLYIRLAEALLGDEWERFRSGDYGPKETRHKKPGLGILAELAGSVGLLYPALPEEVGDAGEGGTSGGSSGRGSGRSRPSSRKRTRR